MKIPVKWETGTPVAGGVDIWSSKVTSAEMLRHHNRYLFNALQHAYRARPEECAAIRAALKVSMFYRAKLH